MTDMRRTLLWVIFTMSLVLLWDAWQKHNGQPSMFSPAPAKTAAPAPGAAGGPAPTATPAATGGGVPTPAAVATGGAAPALPSGAPAAAAQTVTVTTDVVRATFSTRGGELQKLELLRHRDPEVADRQVVLFDQSPQRVYLAQTGLITNQPGVALPNHLSTLQLASTQTELKDGESSVQVRFETPDAAHTRNRSA
jgi:YidC/Oxa1 family membrane protein insertase